MLLACVLWLPFLCSTLVACGAILGVRPIVTIILLAIIIDLALVIS
jgi:hypothetical protein